MCTHTPIDYATHIHVHTYLQIKASHTETLHVSAPSGEDQTDSAISEVKENWLRRQSIEGFLNLRYKYKHVDPKDSHYLHQAAKKRCS